MEKRRTIRYSDEEQSNGVNPLHGNPTIVNYSSTTIVNMSDPDSDEKKYLYTKPRFIAVLVSAIILVIYGMFVLSRSDIVHIALFHHTGDYHANNHVVQKIEEHKGLFIHDNRDIDAPPSAPLAARTRTEDPALLTKFGFHEEEFVRSATTTQVMNENKSAAKQDNMVVEDPSGLINNRNAESQKSLPVLNSVDSLKSEMDAQIALVRKMKYEDHVVMEVDSKAKAEIAKLQELVRHYITQVYGEGPFYLEMELQFPVSMQENGRSDTEKIIIELGPIKLIPYSVYYFLQLVENWKVNTRKCKFFGIIIPPLLGRGVPQASWPCTSSVHIWGSCKNPKFSLSRISPRISPCEAYNGLCRSTRWTRILHINCGQLRKSRSWFSGFENRSRQLFWQDRERL